MPFDPLSALGLVVTAFLAALFGVLLMAALQRRLSPARISVFSESFADAEFLFDGEVLIDANPAARSLLPDIKGRAAPAWPRLLVYLERFFPAVSDRISQLKKEGTFTLSSAEGTGPALMLRAEWRGGLTRISLIDTANTDVAAPNDGLTRHAVQEELELLRDTVSLAPLPVWRESADGSVVWANARYLALAAEQLAEDEDFGWPLPRLFDRTASAQGATSQRQKLADKKNAGALWFELHGFDETAGRLVFAQPADSLVRAEDSLNDFMQTLTKTFAHLSTGLAIFDKNRRLALFNPALVDLTGLAPDILIARPTLITFFDGMRDRSMIPEPRDYRAWRAQITHMEKAAASGLYEETWNLSGGQTYRVTGRPHPNGALALLFEDISAEMTQTRRYRADLELGQAVIDAMEDAIAVFSAAGILVMSNSAYSRLWGHDPAATLGNDGGILAVCEHWRRNSAPGAIWDRAEDFVAQIGERAQWAAETRMTDGRRLHCRFAALAGGATLAAFDLLPEEEACPAVTFTSSRRIA